MSRGIVDCMDSYAELIVLHTSSHNIGYIFEPLSLSYINSLRKMTLRRRSNKLDLRCVE